MIIRTEDILEKVTSCRLGLATPHLLLILDSKRPSINSVIPFPCHVEPPRFTVRWATPVAVRLGLAKSV